MTRYHPLCKNTAILLVNIEAGAARLELAGAVGEARP